MVTANVWERVVQVQCGPSTGTGFTVDQGGFQYLVTAAHVVETGDPIHVRVRGAIAATAMQRLAMPTKSADVAVFRVDPAITVAHPLQPTMNGLVFGQDAYFLGFPLGLTFDIGPSEYFPLVKRATISALTHRILDRRVLLLDGWNNPGFSGGPVVFRPPTPMASEEPLRVCGIITAYWREVQTLGGAEVLLNSGIIIAEEINRVLEAIDHSGQGSERP